MIEENKREFQFVLELGVMKENVFNNVVVILEK